MKKVSAIERVGATRWRRFRLTLTAFVESCAGSLSSSHVSDDLPDTAKGRSTTLEASGPEGPLAGTLERPADGDGPFDTVLIWPGSGPVDRDGNVSGILTASTYRLLAEGLAARGIASVRVDKRGVGESRDAGDGNDVTLERYADDVEHWAEAIRGVPELSGDVWLAGHSEGALIATVAVRRPLPGLCGLVLLSAPGRPLGVVLREQLAGNPANAPVLGEAFSAIETLERGGSVDPETLHPGLRRLFAAPPQAYLAELIRFDPAAALGALDESENAAPVLIVHGSRDFQIAGEDARALARARPDAELLAVADMNHVLKRVASDDREVNVATYTDQNLPIVPAVVDAIADFVARTRSPDR